VDKLEKIGIEGIRQELTSLDLAENQIGTLIHLMTNDTFLAQSGKLEAHKFSVDRHEANVERLGLTLNAFNAFSNEDEGKREAGSAISNLLDVVGLARGTSASNHIKFDPSLARGLSYYTGTIMEINVPDLA